MDHFFYRFSTLSEKMKKTYLLEVSLRACSTLTRAREWRRAKQSFGKESGEETFSSRGFAPRFRELFSPTFFISETGNSLSVRSRSLKKIYQVEHFARTCLNGFGHQKKFTMKACAEFYCR